MKNENMIGYKGFSLGLSCQGMTYRLGETFSVEGKLEMCSHGLHFCKNPLCVLAYYPPYDSRYARVVAADEVLQESDPYQDTTKCCARTLTIEMEIDPFDIAFCAENYMAEHSRRDSKHIYTEVYYEGHVDATYVKDPYSYWVGRTSLVVGAEMHTCIRNTGGGVALAVAPFSIATTERCWQGISIAINDHSIARATSGGSCAITFGNGSMAITEGDHSATMVGGGSLAIVKGNHSVGITSFRASKIRLDGDGCVAMAHGDVEVHGRGCFVILAPGYDRKSTIKSIVGTKLFIPFLDTLVYTEIVCGVHPAWPAGIKITYKTIMENYLREDQKNV